jgi:hypothetical protein
VKDNEKELVMQKLVLGLCKFLHEGGANLAPADTQYYPIIGLPRTITSSGAGYGLGRGRR